MKPNADQRPDRRSDPDVQAPGEGHLPTFESEQHAEWRVEDGGVFVLRLDRTTGAWSGEQQARGGPSGSNPMSPHEVEIMARGRKLRFRDGVRAG